jgi:hypothetical protein
LGEGAGEVATGGDEVFDGGVHLGFVGMLVVDEVAEVIFGLFDAAAEIDELIAVFADDGANLLRLVIGELEVADDGGVPPGEEVAVGLGGGYGGGQVEKAEGRG